MNEKSKTAKKPRIVMLGHKQIPSRDGGVEVVVEELSTRMAKLGYTVSCFNRKKSCKTPKENKAEKYYKGIHLKTVPTIRRKGLSAVSSSVFGAIKAAFGPYDVVHFHAEGPSFMCWLPKLTGKKVIVTVHGLDWDRAKWGKFASWYIKSGEKNAVKYSDELIVLSKQVQRYFKDTYNRETVYIPNGVNTPKNRSADKIKKLWGLEKDSYVLFLGRLVPEKGIHYLIDAFKGISDKKLVITGGSSDSDEYEKKLKGMTSNAIFTGFQDGEILEELYSNAYIYCLPSDLEGMPLSLLEAMSFGNCCLVSDIAECTEVIENNGVTFKKGDVSDLRRELQRLIMHPEIAKSYKKGAKDFICSKYNWDDVVMQTLEVYKK